MDDDGKRRKVSVNNGVTDQDKTVISKIMQRFRPIAPKPTVGESSEDTKSCRFLGRNRRSKRKYVRVRNKNTSGGSNYSDRKISKKNGCDREELIKTDLDGDDRDGVVTLQLLPEKDIDLRSNEDQAGEKDTDPNDMDPKTGLASLYESTVGLSSSIDRTVVESWLTMESLSDTCTDLNHELELSRMDQGEERVMRMLDADTCPWFISDGSNRVYWVNRAYREMMGDPDVEVIRVWLLVAMDLMEEIACMVELYGAVTCRATVRYKPMVKMTVPCDVLRIRSSGRFAWRLDVESALRLGR